MQTQTGTTQPFVQPAQPLEAMQRVILYGVSWDTYERLLADLQDSHAVHCAYDRGVLEIMAPSAEHERPNRTIALFVEEVAAEMGIDVDNVGSNTFKREDLARGFEPDTCFYIQNAERVKGKTRIDLTLDPPPDLVIEIAITSPLLNKFPIFAALGIPEIWRYDGKAVTIYVLEQGEYRAQETSLALPKVTNRLVSQFLEDSRITKRSVWIRNVRAWAQQQKD